MANAPNIGILILAQLLSTIGDAFGQRVSRVDHKGNYPRMMISIAIVSAVQMIILVGILQIELPLSLTSAIYDSSTNERTTCYDQVDITWTDVMDYSDCQAKVNTTQPCTVVDCPSQGASSMLRFLIVFPMFFLTGVVNTIYYVGESLLYREPLGLVFIVISALSSSFLIRPINIMFGLDAPDAIPSYIMALGVTGVVLSVIEYHKSVPEKTDVEEGNAVSCDNLIDSEGSGSRDGKTKMCKDVDQEECVEIEEETERFSKTSPGVRRVFSWATFMYSLRILFPFVLLSICYALWFVLMKYFNDTARANAWGYNAIDQGILPIFVIPFLYVVFLFHGMPYTNVWRKVVSYCFGEEKGKKMCGNVEEKPESFSECWAKWKEEVNVTNVFIYRFFINVRAFLYTYLAVLYDMNVVYLEVQLLRVIMSWLGSLVLCFLFPKFIQADKEEIKRSFTLINTSLKVVGTGLAVAGLVLLNT